MCHKNLQELTKTALLLHRNNVPLKDEEMFTTRPNIGAISFADFLMYFDVLLNFRDD